MAAMGAAGLCTTPFLSGPSRTCRQRHEPLARPHQYRRREQRQCSAVAASASAGAAGVDPSKSVDIATQAAAEGAQSSPWGMGFQCNERYLKWDDSAQRQLIKIWCAQQLDVSLDDMDLRLAELALLLPDLVDKLDRLQAKLVLELVRDLAATSQRILELRQLLPRLNLGAMLAQYPWLLTHARAAPDAVRRQLAALQAALPAGVDVERLIAAEPMYLLADMQAVLAELRRLLPAGQDAVAVLLADPSAALDMQAAGLKASLEIDDGIRAA